MLHPAIEVRTSCAIQGNGLFAKRMIAKGTVIWRLEEPTYTLDEISAWPQVRQKAFEHYGFQCGVGRYSLPEDMSREMNHSCDPNTWWSGADSLVARYDIRSGEEITYDYTTTDIDLPFRMKCDCKAECCRGVITNMDYQDPQWQKQYGSHLPPHVLKAINRLAR